MSELQDAYLSALALYQSKPFANRHTDKTLSGELASLEYAMLTYPPLCRSENGMWLPRGKGLIEPGRRALPIEAMSFAEAGLKVIPENEISDVIDDPNRTPPGDYTEHYLDQLNVGSCGCEGSVRGLMNRRKADGQKHILLNPWMAYSVVSGGVDRGSNPREVMGFLQKYGCCSMDVRSRSRGWRPKPTEREYEDAKQYRILPDGLVWARNWPEARTLLALGFPLPFGYSGHWICGVDLVSATRLVYDNSWGKSWGDKGRGTIRASSIHWDYGVVGIISVTDRRAA